MAASESVGLTMYSVNSLESAETECWCLGEVRFVEDPPLLCAGGVRCCEGCAWMSGVERVSEGRLFMRVSAASLSCEFASMEEASSTSLSCVPRYSMSCEKAGARQLRFMVT